MNSSVKVIQNESQTSIQWKANSLEDLAKIEFVPEFCAFSGYLCRRERLQGHDYCLEHILEDKNSPFKQCKYVYSNKKRCIKAAPKVFQGDELCYEHYVSKQKTLEHAVPSTLTEHCMTQLEKYRPETDLIPESLQECRTRVPTLIKRPVDGSDWDDDDGATLENAWKNEIDSEAESEGSGPDNHLKHAGTFTVEEGMKILHDKMTLLRDLCVNQLEGLRCVTREANRAYRVAHQMENLAGVMPIGEQSRDSIEEILAYQEAKAMIHYTKPHEVGPPAKRRKPGGSSKASQKKKCSYNLTSSTKCGEVCIPLSKFCNKHIMNDKNQVLFQTCGATHVNQDAPCETPVVPLSSTTACVFHANFSQPVLLMKKENEQSFERESKPAINGEAAENLKRTT